MNTDELIRLLSTNVEPVRSRQVVRQIAAAVVAGTGAMIAAVLIAGRLRADIDSVEAMTYLSVKLAFAFAVIASSTVYLTRFARPGGEVGTRLFFAAWPLAALTLLALVSLVFAPLRHWQSMAMGDQWLECLISIPLLAVVPFAIVVWAVRRMAPTDLSGAGALVGLVSGGMSAAGYALHCTDDSLLFVSLWYSAGIALCTLVGALLGPRLLRW